MVSDFVLLVMDLFAHVVVVVFHSMVLIARRGPGFVNLNSVVVRLLCMVVSDFVIVLSGTGGEEVDILEIRWYLVIVLCMFVYLCVANGVVKSVLDRRWLG